MKELVIGILAHVDAGKTTLSESLLYMSGTIRSLGRVDHKTAYLDVHTLERNRGITIFSKQAMISLEHTKFTLLDTPGHVDFSAEMERTLQVLDYAILVINGLDGVQGHTKTLWRLLEKYRIPVFLFVNKMDQDIASKCSLLTQVQQELSEACIDFGCSMDVKSDEYATFLESVAMCDEVLLEQYLTTGAIQETDIREQIRNRTIFPCYFGSALKLSGVQEFLDGLDVWTVEQVYPETFAARVFKISRDEQGNRLTHMKITGGSLKVKAVVTDELEKVNQIRVYSGAKYEVITEAMAGTVCAVTGLNSTHPGEGLGMEKGSFAPLLVPVLSYQILFPDGCDPMKMLPNFLELEEEIPELHVVWEASTKTIQVQMMGEVQTEILQSIVKERFGTEIQFGTGNIVYKETITDIVEGVGHFEPLRHYAEVHLLLEPLERGSGLQFETDCSEDLLERNWQRLVLTHLQERQHKGVLLGVPITDLKITLKAGRAHQKHTEGGDFRQATYRAVRHGLKRANSIVLEPYYAFRLELPDVMLGRAMSDLDQRQATFQIDQSQDGIAVLTGQAPVVKLQNYHAEVVAYTKGQGKFLLEVSGYDVCHNSEEIINSIGYDSETDIDHPTGSVFCAHGAGFSVPWNEVESYMHLESILQNTSAQGACDFQPVQTKASAMDFIEPEEIDDILKRTFHANKKDTSSGYMKQKRTQPRHSSPSVRSFQRNVHQEEYLLIDGYNILFANEELSELAQENMDAASQKLSDVLCNYQAIRGCHLLLVYDAYRVKGHNTECITYHNIQVIYTKEAETADQYIEKFAQENARNYRIIVATSDGVEQIIIRSQGCELLSAREFWEEIDRANKQQKEQYLNSQPLQKVYLFDSVSKETAQSLEEMRLNDET